MGEQLTLLDLVPECQEFMDIKKKAEEMAKASMPYMLEGEERDEYKQDLKDETRLCYVELLRKLADKIEAETLARQNHVIEVLYGKPKRKGM